MDHLVTILHLSDLHFGRHHRFEAGGGVGSLLDRFRQDLDERRDRDGLRPDLIVLSGDLAEHGRKEELDRAHGFADGLARLVELPRRRVVMVPGNHDINWHKSKAYFEECDAEEIAPTEPYFPKFTFYKRFFDRFYEGEAAIAFTEAEPHSFFEYPELGVVVAGLNSAMAESHRDGDHHGFLGEPQMRAFAEKLRPYKERGFLRVGVMHHDPLHGTTEQDRRDMTRLLRGSLNLVLHGDAQMEREEWLHGTVPVLGVGSASASAEPRALEIPNEYQILQIHSGGVRRALRAYVPDQEAWRGSTRIDQPGDRSMVEVPVAFDCADMLGEAVAPAPAADLAQLVEGYRRAIARDQGTPTVFDLLRVNESGESAGGLDFLRLFVPQYAERTAAPRPRREDLYERGLLPQPPEEPAEAPRRLEPFDGLLDRARPIDELLAGGWLFLLGAPGAGKTALTRWLLLELCTPGESVPGLAENLVPVRVEMRRFDEEHRRAAGPYTFFDHLDREHGERFLNLRGESLRALARAGRLYWLFDGLDEVVDEERRRRYAEMIGGLAAEYATCRGITTSRITGAEVARPLLERGGFTTCTLHDFTDDQRDRFLDAWHALVFTRDPETGRQRRLRMANAIGGTPSVRDLCKNPLLCALLAYLNREEELPQRRHRLYQRVLERMTEHWDANKGLPALASTERFDLESKLLFLRRLAWHMLEDAGQGAGNAIGEEALQTFASAFCEERWGVGPDTARRTAEPLIRQLHHRNGVLAFFGGTTYGFAHRTFLEHLAAVEAHERFRGRLWEMADLERLFARRWQDAAWEETLLLLCGLLADGNPDDVVRALQGVVAEDPAIVYGALDEHLAFCISVLGELPQLEKGLPFEFVREINDILVFRIHNPPPLNERTLRGAFRRCAGRWPGLDKVLAAAKEEIAAGKAWMADLYECWILAGGRDRRVVLLAESLHSKYLNIEPIAKEASSFGPWSPVEIANICALAAEQPLYRRVLLLGVLMDTPGMTWNDNDGPVQMLLTLVRRAKDSEAAYKLARSGHYRVEALRFLREQAQSEERSIAQTAVSWMITLGYGIEVVDLLEKYAVSSPGFVGTLAELSQTSYAANAALQKIKAEFGSYTALPGLFFDAVRAVANRGFMLAPEEEILDRLRAIEDPRTRLTEVVFLQYNTKLIRTAIRAYDELYSESRDAAFMALLTMRVSSVDQQRGGQELLDLWSKILGSDVPSIAVTMAGHIWRTVRATALQKRARQRLLEYLGDDRPESTRLHAARNLGIRDPAGRECHRVLARTARLEKVRYNAARFIGDLDTLNWLAERAQDPQWREQAKDTLDLYGHLDFLSKVGRPRRARVLFEGREVGTLEETSAGGATRFRYTPGAEPIAPNLPVRSEPYESDTLHPFFANLLPEGPLYAQTARRLNVKRSDRFGMLLRVGGDVMGAVQVLPVEKA